MTEKFGLYLLEENNTFSWEAGRDDGCSSAMAGSQVFGAALHALLSGEDPIAAAEAASRKVAEDAARYGKNYDSWRVVAEESLHNIKRMYVEGRSPLADKVREGHDRLCDSLSGGAYSPELSEVEAALRRARL